jgi:transposase
LVQTRGAGACEGAAQLGKERHAAFEHEHRGHGSVARGRRCHPTREVFEAYLEGVLAPTLSPGQVVVMDNLGAHKGGRVREIIEGRGCELLLYLPPYSPDLNPIEEAFAKLKGLLRRSGARSRQALVEAMGMALDAITARDSRGFFRHCGYYVSVQTL